jgi:hypothetical protein
MTEATAWNIFSKYIRTRDCLKTTGLPDVGRCYTCGALKPIQELDAGHFVKSIHKDVKFDERNVRAQCRKCNSFEGGQEAVFCLKLIDEIGREQVDYLQSRKFIPKVNDFSDISKTCRQKIKDLLE